MTRVGASQLLIRVRTDQTRSGNNLSNERIRSDVRLSSLSNPSCNSQEHLETEV